MNETDLPCSDCGTELIEATVPATDLPLSVTTQQPVRVAACPSCESHYYPDETLATLAETTVDQQGGR